MKCMRVSTDARTKDGNSAEFEVKVGMHEGSVLTALLFIIMMEVLLSQNVKEGLPRKLLFIDNLGSIAETWGSFDEQKEK